MMIAKVLGLFSWAITFFCGWSIYSIVNMLITGIGTHDIWLVLGSGIFLYLFLGIFVIGAFLTFIVGLALIFGSD